MNKDFRTVYEKAVKLNLLQPNKINEDEFKDFDFSNPSNQEKIINAFATYTGKTNGKITKRQFEEMGEILGFNFSNQFFYQLAIIADFKGNEEYSISHLLNELSIAK